jgi:hypothetical protein
LDSYTDYLLEFIAWRSAAGNKELEEFRKWIKGEYDALSVGSAKEILRHVPTQPPARAGELPEDGGREDVGVRINTGEGPAAPKRKDFFP